MDVDCAFGGVVEHDVTVVVACLVGGDDQCATFAQRGGGQPDQAAAIRPVPDITLAQNRIVTEDVCALA